MHFIEHSFSFPFPSGLHRFVAFALKQNFIFRHDFEYEKFSCLPWKMNFTYKISVKLTDGFTIGKSKASSSN